jgi:hypothetical protein
VRDVSIVLYVAGSVRTYRADKCLVLTRLYSCRIYCGRTARSQCRDRLKNGHVVACRASEGPSDEIERSDAFHSAGQPLHFILPGATLHPILLFPTTRPTPADQELPPC